MTSRGLRESTSIAKTTHLSSWDPLPRMGLRYMDLTKSIFFERHNLTVADLETYLNEALSRGGDYADLYFEYRINHSIVLEEQIIKSATKSMNLGVGVRVISGEKTGYAYSDDLNAENVIKAARTAAFIANASSQGGRIQVPTPLQHG